MSANGRWVSQKPRKSRALNRIDLAVELVEAVTAHYGHTLGRPQQQVEVATPNAGTISLLEYENQPVSGAKTIVTAGLSTVLSPPGGIELLFACHDRYYGEEVRYLLIGLADELAANAERRGIRPPFGTVFGPRGPLVRGTKMSVLGAIPPVFHDADLGRIVLDDGDLVIQWLVPLYDSEGAWLREHGYAEFVKRLRLLNPDFLDLSRAPMNLEGAKLTAWERFRLRFL